MRAFLEQYGVAMFTIIVTMTMVLMSSSAGAYIESLLVKEITKLTEKGGLQTDNVLSGGTETKKEGPVLIEGSEFNDILHNNSNITSIEFLNTAAPDSASIDVSVTRDGTAMAWIDGTTFKVAPKVAGQVLYANPDSSYMFSFGYYDGEDWQPKNDNISNVNFTNLDTSKVTNMEGMFLYLGNQENEGVCTVIGLENFNTSNVTNMSYTFNSTFFYNQKEVKLDLSKWDVSNVTDMYYMFSNFAGWSNKAEIIGLDKWDVSSVTDMGGMFNYFNGGSTFDLDLSNWGSKTKNVKNMRCMFYEAGRMSETFNLNVSNWDVSSVTDMSAMFENTGYWATEFNLNMSNWNVSSVKDMHSMFKYTGKNATTFSLTSLENWNTNNVTNKKWMFDYTGQTSGFTPPSWYQ